MGQQQWCSEHMMAQQDNSDSEVQQIQSWWSMVNGTTRACYLLGHGTWDNKIWHGTVMQQWDSSKHGAANTMEQHDKQGATSTWWQAWCSYHMGQQYGKMVQQWHMIQYSDGYSHDCWRMMRCNIVMMGAAWCSTVRCNMIIRSNTRLGESVEVACLQLSSTSSCIILLEMIYALIKSKCWLLLYMYSLSFSLSLSLSLLNYWGTYKKNWPRVSPHWGLSLASTTSCVLLSWLVFCDLCLCSICNLL